MNKIRKILFKIFRLLPLSKNKIVFLAHSGDRLDCNPKAIFEELLKGSVRVKYIWILHVKLHSEYKSKYPQVLFVAPNSFKTYFHLSTCRVFINNQIHVHYKKIGFIKKAEQLYLQTWHGSFGMKSVPISDDIGTVSKACNEMDYWITNSFFESEVYRSVFDKNARFLEIGHARSDCVYLEQNGKVHSYYGLKGNEKLVLFVPTKQNITSNEILDFIRLKNVLEYRFGGEFVLLARVHRNNSGKLWGENVIDAFSYPDVMELIRECDCLISDYSSIICDFALTYKPIFVYASDYDTFVLTNELYHDYSKLPFGLAKNFQELESNILNFNDEVYKQGVRRWLESVGCIENGEASKKIVSLICQFINKDKNIQLPTNQITPYIAKIMGFSLLYFTFRNIGDQIIMMRALETLHRRTKQVFLVGTTLPDLWKEVSFVKVITLKEVKLHIYAKEQFDLMSSYGIKPVFITQESFKKRGKKFIRTYGPSHIVANVCSKLGLKGEVVVDLNFPLSQKEKSFGCFASSDKKQIAIVSGGLQRYKTYPFEKLQSVVESLKDEYCFIQIGTKKDLPLRGALDLREKITLREVASVLYNSDLFVGGIGGLMHLANAVGCPSVVLYSEAEPEYMVNYNNNINVFPLDNPCIKCQEGNHCPWTSPCEAEGEKYTCIDNIAIEEVIEAIHQRIGMPRDLKKPTIYNIESRKVFGLEEQREVGFPFAHSHKGYVFWERKKAEGKKVLSLSIFGVKPISFLWKKGYYKLRLFNIHLSLDKKIIKCRVGEKNTNLEMNSCGNVLYDVGRADWIKGGENYVDKILHYQRHFDRKSLELLHYIFQAKILFKRNGKQFIQTEYFGKSEEILVRNELVKLHSPIGRVHRKNKTNNVYWYAGFATLIKVQNSYVILHKCFMEDRYFAYIQNNDIIDIGSGNGLSSLYLSEYTKAKVYSFEASSVVYELFLECISLNCKQGKIIPHNIAIGSKRQSVYVSNYAGDNTTTSLNANSNAVFMDTMDNIVSELGIKPKMINVWANGDEYECLLGMLSVIKTFRPILHINLSRSQGILFSVIDLAIEVLEGYSFKIQKTIEPHITRELFLIATPREIEVKLSIK